MAAAAASAQDQPVTFTRSADQIEISIAGKPFSTYFFDPKIAKAYLQPLRSAEGTIVTRGFPLGDVIPPENRHDPNLEPHQRPMYFAHGNIDGYDFWGEEVFVKFYGRDVSPHYGRMVFRKLDEMNGGPHSGTIEAEFDLTGGDHIPIAEETQQYTFAGTGDTRTIDCTFVIHANHGPVRMGDTKEGTFAIRVAQELDSPPGRMVNSAGGEGEPQIWGKQANWVDYDGVVGGEKVGIAIFDSPKSFRHPTYWHARAYGLFAANPFGLKEFTRDRHQDGSYTIPAGQSITFRYRVLIHHGDYKEAKVAEAYEEYAAQP
ncbi:MAG TPA: PmoA family protein [Terriglobia bacterium]|nr:PmoA family protein [Terriglobia bacterium]